MAISSKGKVSNPNQSAASSGASPSTQSQSDRQAETQSVAIDESTNAVARRLLIELSAYYLAERRGFAPGHELEDWVAAEAEVDQRLERARSTPARG